MQEFKEWLSSRDHGYYKSLLVLEQGNAPVALPEPVESPPGSGRFFYKIPDPDQPGKMVSIDATSRTGEKRATDLLARSRTAAPGAAPVTPPGGAPAAPAPAPAPAAIGSLINPIVSGNELDIGGGRKINLNTRNIMLKREIAERIKKPYRDLTDNQVDLEIAYMANENGLKEYMNLNGKKSSLLAIQQQFVDRYGYSPEEQMARGATKEMTRISPKDWTGIKVKASRLGRGSVPKGATVVPASPLDTKTPLSKETESENRYKLAFGNSYGKDIAKWQPIARVAVSLQKGDPIQAGRFLQYFDQIGPDYTKWNAAQQKEAGIDLSIPIASSEESSDYRDPQISSLAVIMTKKGSNYEEIDAEVGKWIESQGGIGKVNSKAVKYIADKIGELVTPNVFNSTQKQELIKRKDIDNQTKNKLQQSIGGSASPTQQQQPPQQSMPNAKPKSDQEPDLKLRFSDDEIKNYAVYQIIDIISDKKERNAMLKRYIQLKGGLDKLNSSDIGNLAAYIIENEIDKSLLTPQQARELLSKRKDLEIDTKNYLNQVIKNNTQPMQQGGM